MSGNGAACGKGGIKMTTKAGGSRGGSRRRTRRTRGQSCTRRRRRWRRLKIVLSEVATGKRGRKVVALVDVRRAYFYALARRRVFTETAIRGLPASDEHTCGVLRYSLYGTRDAAQSSGHEGSHSRVCGEAVSRGGHCGNRARRRHHDRWGAVGGGIIHRTDIQKV